MSDSSSFRYSGYQGTPEWGVLDKAVAQLAANRDLVETTSHEHIVGFLCDALAAPASQQCKEFSLAKRTAALNRIRRAVRDANADNRDLVAELIEERRLEAYHE